MAIKANSAKRTKQVFVGTYSGCFALPSDKLMERRFKADLEKQGLWPDYQGKRVFQEHVFIILETCCTRPA
jgi:hypothetical protein